MFVSNVRAKYDKKYFIDLTLNVVKLMKIILEYLLVIMKKRKEKLIGLNVQGMELDKINTCASPDYNSIKLTNLEIKRIETNINTLSIADKEIWKDETLNFEYLIESISEVINSTLNSYNKKKNGNLKKMFLDLLQDVSNYHSFCLKKGEMVFIFDKKAKFSLKEITEKIISKFTSSRERKVPWNFYLELLRIRWAYEHKSEEIFKGLIWKE